MKKVININFQGRVIPIEESAYEMLQQYTNSLRRYFAKEEGRDEIISDIENRIAELFMEDLKKGAPCVTDQTVATVINSIGRPEEFDAAGETGGTTEQAYQQYAGAEPRGSLHRNRDDKVLGGVCAGIAHYLKLDPTIVRVLFALVTLGGFGTGILIYIVLWIVLPEKGLQTNVRRRLYRNPEGKVIGGVANGISAYFSIPVWVPRVVFAFPLIIGILNSIFHNLWFWGWDGRLPDFVFSGFGGTLFLIYVILWMVIPEARTASEKLEMRGEKVNLESIKNSVQEELQGLKGRAEKFGAEISERAKEWSDEVNEVGKEASQRSQAFANQAAPVANRAGNQFAHAIGVLFKAFFLFIAGIIVFALFVALMAITFSGVGFWGLKDYVLSGFWPNLLAFNTVALLLGIPVIAAIVWIIRRMTGARSGSYLGWIFGSLWTIGLISAVFLMASISRDFKRSESVEVNVPMTNPSNGKLAVDVMPMDRKFYSLSWFDDENDNDFPALTAREDSMLLNTVRIKIDRSNDSNYHAYLVKFARSNSPTEAEAKAERIEFPVKQMDSVFYLGKGLVISEKDKFRNQRVLVVIEVPAGKQIRIDESTDQYDWFNISTTRSRGNRGMRVDWDEDWERNNDYRTDVWYTMTATGLERTDRGSGDDWGTGEDENNREEENEGGSYRYRQDRDINIDSIDIKLKGKDTTINIKMNTRKANSKLLSGEEEPLASKKANMGRWAISVRDLMKI
jgi:phage shock protein PspC (stress-responsive transcriptional regulator)